MNFNRSEKFEKARRNENSVIIIGVLLLLLSIILSVSAGNVENSILIFEMAVLCLESSILFFVLSDRDFKDKSYIKLIGIIGLFMTITIITIIMNIIGIDEKYQVVPFFSGFVGGLAFAFLALLYGNVCNVCLCRKEVEAKVDRINKRRTSKSINYYPVYKYMYEGIEYVSQAYNQCLRVKRLKKNIDKVYIIKINANNPKECRTPGILTYVAILIYLILFILFGLTCIMYLYDTISGQNILFKISKV